ncbi:MAG: response regulator [Terriglobia bacterium]
MAYEAVPILLVDDNPADVELTLHSLRRIGRLANQIHVVHDGQEALDFLFCRGQYASRSLTGPPRVILLEMKLPKVDGLDVLWALKTDKRTKSIPVVVLTSSKQETDFVRASGLEADGCIEKPVTAEALDQAIQHLQLFWLAVTRPLYLEAPAT